MCICGEYALIVVDSGFFLLMRYWFRRVMPSFLGGSERCLFFFSLIMCFLRACADLSVGQKSCSNKYRLE